MTHPLRLAPGPVDLSALSTEETPDFDGGKSEGKEELAELGPELADLQEKLFAEGRSGGRRSVLLVLQGMDTSGKGGTVRHTMGLVDPQGVSITAFGPPTAEELEHDFLWRIEQQLPEPGRIGVFDRSHYEDVLIGRVRALAGPEEIERRYEAINDFEARVAASGTTIVKCLLHISAAEQKERLAKRLDRPDKHWKFQPGDIDDRSLWPAFQEAYEIALERTNTEAAPWYVVPADRKWYRNLAVARLLVDTLREMDLAWPEADFDVAEQQRRLRDADPLG
ncbi:polyphosphate kinase 2 family protein [Nocardioides panacisoli]|uniref:polyphosphate kinase 2 family protein n=1 Tax=Nocardioides panacisoli TaxID=627624 RepID=UPI001C630C35|nr:polyphosphate kinase 2 family protein [Nocardioides panacisoli]QYJ05277.1 polyphosphate kinase 2 family protein [Nocardioides panacisoli]